MLSEKFNKIVAHDIPFLKLPVKPDVEDVDSPIMNSFKRTFGQSEPVEDNEKQKAIHKKMNEEAHEILNSLKDSYGHK